MFHEELKALKESCNAVRILRNAKGSQKGIFVLLDGPIVDPPSFHPRDEGLKNMYKDYIRSRVETVMKLLSQGCIVAGIIKRIVGNRLVSKVFSKSAGDENYLNDFTFINMVFRKLAHEMLDTVGNCIKDYILVTRPIEVDRVRTDYSNYLDAELEIYDELSAELNSQHIGFRIFHFYVLPSICDYRKKILGVELAVPTNKKGLSDERFLDINLIIRLTRRVSEFLHVWTLPGQSYPLPIILAHRSCTIKRKTAKKVLKDLTARFIRDTLVFNTSIRSLQYLEPVIDSLIE